jgi:hypothetical protein
MRDYTSRRKLILSILGVLLIAALIVGVLTARPIEDKTPKIQSDWSRGVRVGKSPWNQPPTLRISDDGQRVHLAWADNGPSGTGVHYLQLDERARRVTEQWSEAMQGTPISAQILLDSPGRPHMFVMARISGDKTLRLFHWSLNADGAPRIPAHPISPAGVEVVGYAVTPGEAGSIQVFWAADPETDARGLYLVRLDADGQVVEDHRRLNERPAQQVSAQADRQGNTHVIWGEPFSGPSKGDWYRVMYAVFSNGNLQSVDGTLIEQADAPPKLGVDGQRVYALWGKEVKSGMLAGMGFTGYTSFPLGQPNAGSSASLSIPANGQPEYVPYQGEYRLKTIGSMGRMRPSDITDYVHSPAPVPGQHDEMAVATIAALTFGSNERFVPTLVMLRDGRATGYQVIASNDGYNAQPALAADSSGNLYAAWLTGSTGAGFRIYYAATTAAARAQLDASDLTDFMVATAVTAWQMLGGLALLPFFPLVVLPAFLIIVVYSVFGQRGEGLSDRQAYVVLIASCLTYWLAKEIILGAVLTEPIVARELAGWSRTLVIWAIQLGIAAVSGGFMWWQMKRRQMDSILWPVLIFIACDMVLTMLAAGPTLAQRG